MRGLEQPVDQLERIELAVAGRPLRPAHLGRVQGRRLGDDVLRGQHLDRETLGALDLGHGAPFGLLALVGEQVERPAALPLDPFRQLCVDRLEQVERAAGVLGDRSAGARPDQRIDAREVSAHPGQGQAAQTARSARGGGVGLDDERTHSGSRQVVGGPGAHEPGADHDHLRARRELDCRIRLEGHALGGREVAGLARAGDRHP